MKRNRAQRNAAKRNKKDDKSEGDKAACLGKKCCKSTQHIMDKTDDPQPYIIEKVSPPPPLEIEIQANQNGETESDTDVNVHNNFGWDKHVEIDLENEAGKNNVKVYKFTAQQVQDIKAKLIKLGQVENENSILKSRLMDAYKRQKEDNSYSVSYLSKSASTLSHLSIKHLFQCKDQALKNELKEYINSKIFPACKFPISKELQKAFCKNAVTSKNVFLPNGTTKEQFAEVYHKEVNIKLINGCTNTQNRA